MDSLARIIDHLICVCLRDLWEIVFTKTDHSVRVPYSHPARTVAPAAASRAIPVRVMASQVVTVCHPHHLYLQAGWLVGVALGLLLLRKVGTVPE